MYTYQVRVDHFHDGDTITAHRLDLGFGLYRKVSRGESGAIRLVGINCPEVSTPEGRKVRDFVKQLEGHMVTATSVKQKKKMGKFGRYLFDIYCDPSLLGISSDRVSVHLNQVLLDRGMATPFD